MIVMKTSFILVSVYSIAVRGTVLSQADFIDLVINFGDIVKTIPHTFFFFCVMGVWEASVAKTNVGQQ